LVQKKVGILVKRL